MKKENEEKLFNRFKFFHPEKSPQEGLMCFGFEVGNGWFDLLWKLCENIEKELDKEKNKELESHFEVEQVKEKFGQLRYYCNYATDEIFDLIEKAEIESGKTCEVCGEKGELRTDSGWIYTACDKHYKKKVKK